MPEPLFIKNIPCVFFSKMFLHADTLSVHAPVKSNAYDVRLKNMMAVASPTILKNFASFIYAPPYSEPPGSGDSTQNLKPA